jgi:bacillithiol biosynthesis cysteine-adding enzyme BshC
LWESVERFLKTNLRETEFRSEILRRLQDTFERSKTWSEWMVRILWDLFRDEGLLITLPEDGFYQRECVEIFEREIESPQATVDDLHKAAETLVESGFRPQIHKKEDLCAFFLFQDGRRRRVEWDGKTFKVGEKTFSRQDLLEILRSDPAAFGASAALRPVCQDAAFTVLAAVLGPGEIGYYAQIGEIYKRHGVPRPAYLPRLSATLFPSRFLDQLKEAGLDPTHLKSPVEEVIKKAVGAKNTPGVREAIANLLGQVETSFDTLGKEGEALDSTMRAALERSEKRIEEIIRQVEDLFTRRAAAADKTLKNRLNTMSNWFFPNSQPQERVLNVFQFLNSYGPELIHEITDLELDTTQGHFLIPL